MLPHSCAALLAWYTERGISVRRVMTDNGSCYVSKLFAGASRRLKHLRTRPYTPRTNGKAERLIQTLQREWAYAQPWARNVAFRAFAVYSAVHGI